MQLSILWKITTIFHILLAILLGLVAAYGILVAPVNTMLGLYCIMISIIGVFYYISFELIEKDQTKMKDIIICFLVPYSLTVLITPLIVILIN